MLSHAIAVGVAGIVINGAVRDYGWIKSNSFPVFAAGITHRGPFKDGPGEIIVPIALDGMVIEPGDLMLGDDDGLLCVPFDQTAKIHEQARAKNEAEAKTLANTQAGKLDPKKWVDESLKKLGCEACRDADGEHRRHRDALRGAGLRSAHPALFARRLRRDGREVADPRYLQGDDPSALALLRVVRPAAA
jgi:hypothetical protein